MLSKPRPHKNSLATSINLEGRFLSDFFFEKSRSNVCEKYLLTEDCSGWFTNPLFSPRNEHSKTIFRKKNSEKFFGELDIFSENKFDPATGVTDVIKDQSSIKFKTAHHVYAFLM